jgi:hypothetical protein
MFGLLPQNLGKKLWHMFGFQPQMSEKHLNASHRNNTCGYDNMNQHVAEFQITYMIVFTKSDPSIHGSLR